METRVKQHPTVTQHYVITSCVMAFPLQDFRLLDIKGLKVEHGTTLHERKFRRLSRSKEYERQNRGQNFSFYVISIQFNCLTSAWFCLKFHHQCSD